MRIIRMRMLSSESELADGGVVVGISSSYQFFLLRKGEVLARSNSCWCPIWFDMATAGPGQGARLAPYVGYKVAGCTRAGSAFYERSITSCRAKTVGDASSPDSHAQTHGHALAAGLAPEGGQLVLVEAGQDIFFRWVQRAFPPAALRNTRGRRPISTRRDSTAGTI
jgi:hypothetical protein